MNCVRRQSFTVSAKFSTDMCLQMQTEVLTLWRDDEEYDQAFPGENIKLKLRNVEEEDVSSGFVLCSPDNLCHTGQVFDAQVVWLLQYFAIALSVSLCCVTVYKRLRRVSLRRFYLYIVQSLGSGWSI